MGTNEERAGLSRRDLIKRGAVAGGIVWSAPVLLSGTAGAAYVGSEEDCTRFFYGKYNTNENTVTIIDGTCDAGFNGSTCFNLGGAGYVAGRTYESGCGTVIDVEGNTLTLAEYHNNDSSSGCKIKAVSGYTKGGSGADACAAQTNVVENTDGSWTITFPASTAAGGFSHVEFSYCC